MGDFQALYGIDLRLEEGETLAIIGANRRGQIDISQDHRGAAGCRCRKAWSYAGRPIGGLSAPQIVRIGISLVPEGRRLFPSLSVEENLAIGAYGRHDGGYWSLARIYELFPALAARRHAPSHTLSGGEQQMAAIGRALMANPRVLLCDEVSLGLAPVVIRNIYAPCRASRRAGPASSWSSRTSCRRCRWQIASTASRKGACRWRDAPRSSAATRSTPRISAHDTVAHIFEHAAVHGFGDDDLDRTPCCRASCWAGSTPCSRPGCRSCSASCAW
jgi:branched-chain amino acid transport system ATP-binding protein